jgi:uncharacterized protein Yka (UPF0111/DUF47 family)
VLLQSARLLHQLMPRLRNFKKQANGMHEQIVEIHRLENIGDDNNHAALAELFNNPNDPIYVMKWKEIYDLTERAIDNCEDIANIIEGIILKNS